VEAMALVPFRDVEVRRPSVNSTWHDDGASRVTRPYQ